MTALCAAILLLYLAIALRADADLFSSRDGPRADTPRVSVPAGPRFST